MCLKDDKFAERHLPTGWWVEKERGEIYREEYFDHVEQMYPLFKKGRSRSILSDFEEKVRVRTENTR